MVLEECLGVSIDMFRWRFMVEDGWFMLLLYYLERFGV